MLPEAGATELIFLGIVALIVVGPKDLPILLRKVGQFTAKMRGLAAEFRASFDELARQSELDELRKEVEALRHERYVPPVATEIQNHFEDLHRGFGADPPPPLTDEGVVLAGPEAAAPPAVEPPADEPLDDPAPAMTGTPLPRDHPEAAAARAAEGRG